MGFFYTNITLKGVEQTPVVEYLQRLKRDAYVSPTINGVTVVYDREGEDQDTAVLEGLAAEFSETFNVPVLAALLHDDDVLWYSVFMQGRRLDEYNSDPAYFLDTEPLPPSGGNAAALARAFGAEDQIEEINAILRQWYGDPWGDDLLAEDRHWALAEALSFPPYAYSTGYYSIGVGNVPEGVDLARLIKTP